MRYDVVCAMIIIISVRCANEYYVSIMFLCNDGYTKMKMYEQGVRESMNDVMMIVFMIMNDEMCYDN